MAQILVIEDEDSIRLMVRLALEHDGHTVGVAAGGLEGVRLFGDGRAWNVVLLDQRMPDMQGLETLGRLKQRDSEAWVIMMTAMGTRELEDEARRAGAADFLRKPFTTETLRASVAAALRGKKPLQKADTENVITVNAATRNGFRIEHHARDGALTAATTHPSHGISALWDRIAHPAAPPLATNNGTGGFAMTFLVENPAGVVRECVVALSQTALSQVRSQTATTRRGDGAPVDEARLWRSLSEEAINEYVAQHADFPPDGKLTVETLDRHLERFIAASARM